MYYQGSSAIEATDDLQTLYLMNPNNVHQPHATMFFLNSADASTSTTVHGINSHAPPPLAQQFVGIPLSRDPNRPLSFAGQQDVKVHAPHEYQTMIPSFEYNLWRSVGHDPNTSLPTPKCLSLSLSSDQTAGLNKSLLSHGHDFLGQSSIGMVLPRISSGVESNRGIIMGSKYLKAAHQILDEVANVGEDVRTNRSVGLKEKAKIIKAPNGGSDGGAQQPTTAQRQEIQMNKAKLVAMLDEVEQRYMNYQHQMHMIVASFEQTAGMGSSKRYTQLASRTISKQFRCLKDAISSQIDDFKINSLCEDENEDKKFQGSRLELSYHRFRQQSALRPQRGLPERAVSVLRAWLFEHFLHPYPKDSDKNMMAKQTGLTRSQVSNWFINARVRLWKPMVEEMYLEEMKNQQHIISEETTTKATRINKELGQKVLTAPNQQENNGTTRNMDQLNAFQSKKLNLILDQVINPSPTEVPSSTVGASFVELISLPNMENNQAQIGPKKPRKEIADIHDNSPNSTLILDTRKSFSMSVANTSNNTHGYFRPYERFSTEQMGTGFHGNNVSLTLALPPSHSPGLNQHQENLPSNSSFEFGKRILGTGTIESGSGVNGLQDSSIRNKILDFQNRKPFPAPVLPDFVA